MTTLQNSKIDPIRALCGRTAICESDVLSLRRDVLDQGFLTREQAEALFELDAAPMPKCEAWTQLFVEALTDHVVWQVRPTGLVTPEIGDWVLEQAAAAGTPTRLALLVNILAEAHEAPLWFVGAVRARAARWPGIEALAARLDAAEAA